MRKIIGIFRRVAAEMSSWLSAILQRSRVEAEMEAELTMHLESLTADLMRAGWSPKEAARRARIALGSVVVHKDGMRASLGLRMWDELGADIRYAVRLLRKSPMFTGIAVLSLALAIGANTAIFSVAHELLMARLKVPHPEQLRMLRWDQDNRSVVHDMWGDFDPDGHGGMMGSIFSYPVYLELAKHNQVLDGLMAFKTDGMNATIHGNAQQVQAEMVTGNYYAVLGVRPQLGRGIEPSDDAVEGAGTAAVISDELWDREFNRSESVLGQTITLNQAVLTIVGVNPAGFTGAKSLLRSPEVFVPLSLQPVVDPKGKTSLLGDPQFWWLNVMGRVKNRSAGGAVPDSEAQAALDLELAAYVKATMPMKAGDTAPRMVLSDGSRGLRFADAMFKKPIYVLLTMTGVVLLLACVNIANLLLARGAQREREMSVRLAMGAGRGRILRQMLVESLLLAAMGGAGGLALAFVGRNWIPGLLANPWQQEQFQVPFEWTIFAFTAGITLTTGLLFGLAPALAAMRAEVSNSLKQAAHTATRRRKGLGGKGAVAFQVALSTILVVGAGLFLRTLHALNSVDTGFVTDHLLLLDVNPPVLRYGPGKDVRLHARLEQAFAAVPGVEGVAPSWTAYIADSVTNSHFVLEGQGKKDGVDSQPDAADVNVVGNDFFQTMGIPLLGGRTFGPQDTATSTKVAIINQALARERFRGVNPIGKRFKTDAPEGWIEVVGICGDTRYRNLREDAPPQFFLPFVQAPEVGGMTYAIRSQLKPAQLVPVLRNIVRQVDRDLPMIAVRTQEEQIDATMSLERMVAALMGGFGLLALALACVGIYGVMAYSVVNRTNEIGIRLALGAVPRQVLTMIMREATWISIAGIAVGLGVALVLARLVKSMLYGLQPADPTSLCMGALLLMLVGAAASWLPARRAASVEPMEALRHE